MRFVCDSCRAQYMISDDKVGPKGVKVRCKKCGYVILVRRASDATGKNATVAPAHGKNGHSKHAVPPPPPPQDDAQQTQVMDNPLTGSPAATLPTDNSDPGVTNPGVQGTPNVLSNVDDDEIGAVFDQVLKTGPNPI